MGQIRFERKLFIFRVGMEIKNDLAAVQRQGWQTYKDGHFITRDTDGTQIVNLILRRPIRVSVK